MPHRFGLILLYAGIVLTAVLAACASYPTALTPVPEEIPQDEQLYPQDASFAAETLFGALQGRCLPGAHIPTALAEALGEGYRYPGFSLSRHHLLEYRDREDGPTGRYSSGIIEIDDTFGRRARFMYSALYTVEKDGLHMDAAEVSAIYPDTPRAHYMLIPKADIPSAELLPATWEEFYTMLGSLNVMPESGLDSAALLETHTLVVFLLDRMPPEADIHFNINLPDILSGSSTTRVGYDQHLDMHGWRIAVIRVENTNLVRLMAP